MLYQSLTSICYSFLLSLLSTPIKYLVPSVACIKSFYHPSIFVGCTSKFPLSAYRTGYPIVLSTSMYHVFIQVLRHLFVSATFITNTYLLAQQNTRLRYSYQFLLTFCNPNHYLISYYYQLFIPPYRMVRYTDYSFYIPISGARISYSCLLMSTLISSFYQQLVTSNLH